MNITIGVKIIESANTTIDDIFQTGSRQYGLRIAGNSKFLLSDAHRDLEDIGAGARIDCLRIASRVDLDSSRGLKQRDDEDRILHVLPAIRPADEIVPAGIVGWSHAGVGGITVHAPRCWSVPIDKFLIGDIVVHRSSPGLEGSDERLGHV